MDRTPRLRSSFPLTPRSTRQSPKNTESSRDVISATAPLPDLPGTAPGVATPGDPVIPVNLVDAPSQRFYALGLYGLLLVWKLYDRWTLIEAETSSLLLFAKWVLIDLAFLFGVPLLRIPWLEWSESTSTSIFLVHALLNGLLMFRVPVRG